MCAVDLGADRGLYEQAASDDGEIMRPKSLTGLPGPMTCAQCGCWMAEATDKFAKCLVGFSEIHSG